jgi:hypothetical protein
MIILNNEEVGTLLSMKNCLRQLEAAYRQLLKALPLIARAAIFICRPPAVAGFIVSKPWRAR